MNNKDQIIENSNFYTKITNKILSLIILSISISSFLILFSFNPEDPGWGMVSDNITKNFYGETGALLSGIIIKEFGLLPGLLSSIILFIWSLKLFNGSKIKLFKIKLLAFILMIFLGSLGGTYFETHLIQKLHLNFAILSQNGLPEGCIANAVLPITIDTPTNRQFMPDADYASWTSPNVIAFLIKKLFEDGGSAVKNGALLGIYTDKGDSEFKEL